MKLDELKAQKRWFLWKYAPGKNGKPTKIPCSAAGKKTGTNREYSKTWVSYDEAIEAKGIQDASGIGFVIPDGMYFLDIDSRDTSDPLVQDLIKRHGTYAEISPSGKGLHLLGTCDNAQLPFVWDEDKQRETLQSGFYQKNPNNHIELYFGHITNRYATFTGDSISEADLTDGTEACLETLDRHMRRSSSQEDKAPESSSESLEDFDIIASLRKQRNAEKFSRLYDQGDWRSCGYGSQSEADAALCSLIAFRVGNDPEAVDRIFRKSALYRPKWERKDYRSTTITGAIESCHGEFYSEEKASKVEAIELDSMEDVEEKDPEWLVPGYLAKNVINILAGDGGTGKSTMWCNLAAAISKGEASLLDWANEDPDDDFGAPALDRDPQNVLFFSSEDSVEMVLKRRLRKAGADMKRIKYLNITDKRFQLIKFNSRELEAIIAKYRPALCVFDPLQSFLPPFTKMAARNDMREPLSALVSLGEKYGTTFLIVMHTNKKQGVYGRTRLADSADVWDIARSVLILGETGENEERYISHEKCNYGRLSPTIIFSNNDEVLEPQRTCFDRDRYFVSKNQAAIRSHPARDEAVGILLKFLEDGEPHEIKEVDDHLRSMEIEKKTVRNAKAHLMKTGKIEKISKGFGQDHKEFLKLKTAENLTDF